MARPQTDIDAGRELLLDQVEELVRKRGSADIAMNELAAAAGMSPSNLYRFFDSKEALLEAVAEKWFADKVAIMEEVTNSDLPVRDKLFSFFARRFVLMNARYNQEPELFKSYCELGEQYFEVIRGYVDLGDHYLAMIIAEAMDAGYFGDLSIDQAVSLINQMVSPYCMPDTLIHIGHKLSEEKLSKIIDTIFIGLGHSYKAKTQSGAQMKIVS
jgi:TetR/AcrR family transcriptional regulator, repressor of the ameABC operon